MESNKVPPPPPLSPSAAAAVRPAPPAWRPHLVCAQSDGPSPKHYRQIRKYYLSNSNREWTKAPGSESAARICPRKSPPKRGLWESYFLQGIIGKTHTQNMQILREDTLGATCSAGPFCLLPEITFLIQKPFKTVTVTVILRKLIQMTF